MRAHVADEEFTGAADDHASRTNDVPDFAHRATRGVEAQHPMVTVIDHPDRPVVRDGGVDREVHLAAVHSEAGEGALDRFETAIEIHSSPGTLFFSYGLIEVQI